jgi:hypothetical protein
VWAGAREQIGVSRRASHSIRLKILYNKAKACCFMIPAQKRRRASQRTHTACSTQYSEDTKVYTKCASHNV